MRLIERLRRRSVDSQQVDRISIVVTSILDDLREIRMYDNVGNEVFQTLCFTQAPIDNLLDYIGVSNVGS